MITSILEATERNVARAAEALTRGEIVGIPTETVYGLAAAAFNENAVAAVFAAKERPAFDPLIVHVGRGEARSGREYVEGLAAARLVDLDRLSPSAIERATRLVAAFWPGALTLVLPKDLTVPDIVTSGGATVAVRMPRHPVAQALLSAVKTPLAAPSANRFGRISPTSAADVLAELSGRVSIILDGGPCEIGLESSVVAVASDGALSLLRPGAVSRADLARVANAPVTITAADDESGPRVAPGRLDSHYAPAKPLALLSGVTEDITAFDTAAVHALVPPDAVAGLLAASGDPDTAALRFQQATGRDVIARALSASGDPVEAARSLFSALRALDGSRAVALFAEPWPDGEGLGHAIADRLRRAAARQR